MIYSVLKPLLFKLDAETAHHLALQISELYQARAYHFSPRISSHKNRLQLPSPIGLAAGLDKNAQALNTLSSLGFGAIEAGTITLKAQAGNPRPRVWRYPEQESLRNTMGFPNGGRESILMHLKNYQGASVLGVNIGKNKESTPSESIDELSQLVSTLKQAQYFTINVSSPNTPGLRALQEPGYLRELFSELHCQTDKPLFLKIAPDLEKEEIQNLLKISEELRLEGIIATNTTIRADLGVGGISGKLLYPKSFFVQEELLQSQTHLTIVGVGGISSFGDILRFWKLGGQWVQVYTAFVYHGPTLIHRLNKEILRFLDHFGIYQLQTFFDLSLPVRRKMIEEYEKKIS